MILFLIGNLGTMLRFTHSFLVLFLYKVFDGNTDQFSVVSHLLKNPIITQYIRIIPVSWQSSIGLRADFYGCKSGEHLLSLLRSGVVVLEIIRLSNGKTKHYE